jgi:predicted permease
MRAAGTDEERRTDVAVVTPDYFRAMGMELVRGRAFGPGDLATSPAVAVIDERLAQRFWPDQDAIGKRVEGWGFRELTVVGVVRHVKNYGVAADSREELFVAHAQRPLSRLAIAVRSSADPTFLVPAVRDLVAELDPDLPVYNVRAMQDVVDATVQTPRLSAVVSGLVAGLALLLATIGLYGVLAFAVGQRRREIGVRLALGASPSEVARLVVAQGVAVAAGGVALGALGALGVVRVVRSQLFGVAATDLVTLAAAAGALVVVTVVASWIPARRAAAVAPAVALRND